MTARVYNHYASGNWEELVELRKQVQLLTPERSAARSLFEGLLDELPKAAETGKLKEWQQCVETTAALIVSYVERQVSEQAAVDATPTPENPNG